MLLINITSCGRLRFTACSNSTLKLAPLDEIMGNTVFLFLFVSIACILLSGKCPCRLSMFKNLYVSVKQFEGRYELCGASTPICTENWSILQMHGWDRSLFKRNVLLYRTVIFSILRYYYGLLARQIFNSSCIVFFLFFLFFFHVKSIYVF